MSTRLCFLYKLRPDVEPAEYERWLREVDVPFATARPTLLRYDCVRIDRSLESAATAPFDYVEILEVTDVEADQALVAGPEAEAIAAQWAGYVSDYKIMAGDPVESFERAGAS